MPTRPMLVEVAGVAGAGKSTLVTALCGEGSGWVRARPISAREPRQLARMLRALPRLLPILAANARMAPRLSWADVKLLAYATGWHGRLGDPRPGARATAVDQGPIYALVRVRARGRGVGRSPAFARWWEAELARWASEIDAVVLLDAADDVLLGRIDGREQDHLAKGASRYEGTAFLARYRSLFDEALAWASASGGPRILRLDTSSAPPEALACRVRDLVEGPHERVEGPHERVEGPQERVETAPGSRA